MNSVVVASNGGPPPAKRARGSNGTSSVDSPALLLMPELWASVLAYLAFDDAKECSAINRFFLSAVAPLVVFRPDVTVKITLPPTVWVETRNNHVGRFRGIKNVRIETLEYETIAGTRAILKSFDGLSSIVARGLSSKNWNQQLGETGAVDVELARAFAPVRDTLRELDLELYPHAGVTKALQSLSGLQQLKLEIPNANCFFSFEDKPTGWWHDGGRYDNAISFGHSLGELGALSHLQVLRIADKDDIHCRGTVAAAFMAGCSQIKSLRVLRSDSNIDWSFTSDDSTAKAFAAMLSNLTNLEEVNVTFPKPQLLRYIEERGGGQKLKRLSCEYCDSKEEDVKLLVRTVLEHFTSLMSVAIELENFPTELWSLEEAMQTLSTLRGHPHLKRLDFYIDESACFCFDRLRELLAGCQVEVHQIASHRLIRAR